MGMGRTVMCTGCSRAIDRDGGTTRKLLRAGGRSKRSSFHVTCVSLLRNTCRVMVRHVDNGCGEQWMRQVLSLQATFCTTRYRVVNRCCMQASRRLRAVVLECVRLPRCGRRCLAGCRLWCSSTDVSPVAGCGA